LPLEQTGLENAHAFLPVCFYLLPSPRLIGQKQIRRDNRA